MLLFFEALGLINGATELLVQVSLEEYFLYNGGVLFCVKCCIRKL